MIATPRFAGAPIGRDDAADYEALFADARVMAALPAGGAALSPEKTHERLDRAITHWSERAYGVWTFRDRAGAFAGYSGLKHAMVGAADAIHRLAQGGDADAS